MTSTIVINGVTISGGRNVTIRNGKVIVDGKDVTPDAKEINISVTGNVERLEADACQKISITGDAGSVTTQERRRGCRRQHRRLRADHVGRRGLRRRDRWQRQHHVGRHQVPPVIYTFNGNFGRSACVPPLD